MNFSLKDIENEIFTFSLVNLICITSPGLLLAFIFYRELFIALSTIKLFLLSIAVTSPILILNIIIIAISFLILRPLNSAQQNNTSQEREPFVILTIGSVVNFTIFSVTLFIDAIFSMNLKNLLLTDLAITMIWGFLVLVPGLKWLK